eukprot:COSAG04_NODE_1627_length_6122_cov_4.279761_6_plen_123_part_00
MALSWYGPTTAPWRSSISLSAMPQPGRRLRSLLAHLRAAEPDPSAAPSGCAAVARAPPKLLDDAAVKSFIMKGWMSLSPEEIGVTREFTQQVYDKMSALHDDKEKKIGCVASPAASSAPLAA